MEVNSDLEVSKEEFFEFLYDTVINDVRDSSGMVVSKKDIEEGFKYEKALKTQSGSLGNIRATIVELDPYERYVAEFQSSQGKNIISYKLREIDDRKINVSYKEEFIGDTKFKAISFKVLNIFYKKKSIRNAKQILKNIEAYIKENRREDS